MKTKKITVRITELDRSTRIPDGYRVVRPSVVQKGDLLYNPESRRFTRPTELDLDESVDRYWCVVRPKKRGRLVKVKS